MGSFMAYISRNVSTARRVCAKAHHPPTPVVVQIHQCASIFHHHFSSIYEGLCKFYAVVDVVAASTPVKIASVVEILPLLMVVAVADL